MAFRGKAWFAGAFTNSSHARVHMVFKRRIKMASALFALAAFLLSAFCADNALAGYPDRIVRIVVPFAPGGGTDVIARTLAQEMARDLGATVIIENKPGAGTIIGTQAVAASEPDGYTLLMGTFANAVNPSLKASLPYDPHAMDEIFVQTRDAAYRIIERKGATYYAVAAGLMHITQAILRNQSTVLSTSSLINDYYGIGDVCFSLPTVIDRGGVENVLRLQLSSEEIEKLRHSAEVLKTTIRSLELG